jgi:SAM-dependent methyltransferase
MLPLRGDVIEIGSGEADFICYASAETQWRISGYDIDEHAGLDTERKTRAKTKLTRNGLSEDLLSWVSAGDGIPASDDSLDIVISIQTLEHVRDIGFLFSEIKRVLRPGGQALHYFPTQEILIDPHSRLPLIHRLPQKRRQLLIFFSQLHLGKYPMYKTERGYSLEHFVEEFDGYHRELCHFHSRKEYLALSQENKLDASFIPLPPLPSSKTLASILSYFTSVCLRQVKAEMKYGI